MAPSNMEHTNQPQKAHTHSTMAKAWGGVPKLQNKTYATNNDAARKLIYRHTIRLKNAGKVMAKQFRSLTEPFFLKLKKTLDEAGLIACTEIVKTQITVKLLISGDGATIKQGVTSTGVKYNHKNGKNMSVDFGHMKVAVKDVQWQIWVGKDHLTTVKKSSISGAGLGLFAARAFEEGELVGLYCGHNVGTLCKKRLDASNKLLMDGDGIIFAPKNTEVWMGAHFCNDPEYSSEEAYNVKIQENLLFHAMRDIQEGEEMFLQYNLEDVEE